MAQRDRVFVASYGSDSNPCTFGSPCKTFQNAVNVVAAGGEVTAIDSAGFGTFTISHAVTITSPNGVEAGVAAPAENSAAITIAAGPFDVVHLNGLTLNGDGVLATGIQFNSGGSLYIQNCVIQNFGITGIGFSPSTSSQLSVSNTLVSDIVSDGIIIASLGSGTTKAVFDHVTMENNDGAGVNVQTNTQTIDLTVTDSVSANNLVGIEGNSFTGGTVNIMVRNSTLANNNEIGLSVTNAGAIIWVTRSTVTGNGTGWSTASGGTLTTFGDNNIVGNGANNSSPSAPVTYQ